MNIFESHMEPHVHGIIASFDRDSPWLHILASDIWQLFLYIFVGQQPEKSYYLKIILLLSGAYLVFRVNTKMEKRV